MAVTATQTLRFVPNRATIRASESLSVVGSITVNNSSSTTSQFRYSAKSVDVYLNGRELSANRPISIPDIKSGTHTITIRGNSSQTVGAGTVNLRTAYPDLQGGAGTTLTKLKCEWWEAAAITKTFNIVAANPLLYQASLQRCDSNGVLDEEGTNCLIAITVKFPVDSDLRKPITKLDGDGIALNWYSEWNADVGVSNLVSFPYSVSEDDTERTFYSVISNVSIAQRQVWVQLADSVQTAGIKDMDTDAPEEYEDMVLPAVQPTPIDIRGDNLGVSFGTTAKTQGFNCSYDADFKGSLTFGGMYLEARETIWSRDGVASTPETVISPTNLRGGTWAATHELDYYDAFEVYCAWNTDYPTRLLYGKAAYGGEQVRIGGTTSSAHTGSGTNPKAILRRYSLQSDGIHLSAATYNGDTDNTYAVPVRIVGIKYTRV